MKVIDELLEEKYNSQKKINEQAGNDLKKYMQKVRLIVIELEKKNNIKFKIKKF